MRYWVNGQTGHHASESKSSFQTSELVSDSRHQFRHDVKISIQEFCRCAFWTRVFRVKIQECITACPLR